MLRVQGNVYVDGNLTIRGLALGVNLPALTKNTTQRNTFIITPTRMVNLEALRFRQTIMPDIKIRVRQNLARQCTKS